MRENILLLPIIIPLASALLIFLSALRFKEIIALGATLFNLLIALILFKHDFYFSLPGLAKGYEFSLRLYNFSAFIIMAVAGFSFLIILYSTVFMQKRAHLKQFYAYFLLTVSFVNGAVLSDNLLLLLFFWEGLLLTLFGMIAIGNKNAFKAATKAFIITGITDLCMMIGIIISGQLAGTMTISKINLPFNTLGSIAFIFLIIGAISKAGSMPFHSWIPDAAVSAPLPFMALVPAAFEKLLGIYFLTRISLDMFKLSIGSWVSTLLMVIGAVTILLAVMMALIQKDYKRLLSYHAISQVGYMILGIGTAVPAGIVGGLFHMINNALYKSCLFLAGGAIERQTGTTDLERLGGLARKMPVTFICFIVAACSISGVPPFNGFFSKELVYDGALERGLIFYIAAITGSFFTAASFLKLGHAAFLGQLKEEHKGVMEVKSPMWLPMVIIASVCVIFGVFNSFVLHNFIQPIIGIAKSEEHSFSGASASIKLIIITLVVLIMAFLNHLFGVKIKGSAIKAADHIRYAPGLSVIYDKAEKKFFDPYEIGMKIAASLARILFYCDRGINWLYDVFIVKAVFIFSNQIRKLHCGNYSHYLVWSLLGLVLVVVFLLSSV